MEIKTITFTEHLSSLHSLPLEYIRWNIIEEGVENVKQGGIILGKSQILDGQNARESSDLISAVWCEHFESRIDWKVSGTTYFCVTGWNHISTTEARAESKNAFKFSVLQQRFCLISFDSFSLSLSFGTFFVWYLLCRIR